MNFGTIHRLTSPAGMRRGAASHSNNKDGSIKPIIIINDANNKRTESTAILRFRSSELIQLNIHRPNP